MFRLFPIKVSFVLTPLEGLDVDYIVVRQSINAMDTARLLIRVAYEKIEQFVTAGSPLVVTWGTEGRSDSFFGYVHTFRPQTDGYVQATEIVAVSAAYPLFNESGRTFYDVGIHNVAQDIGDRFRFQVETDPHPVVNDQILQKTDSDWGLLARLAEQWGYMVMLEGVTLIFRSIDRVLDENYKIAANARTYTHFATPNAQIISFEPNYSATGLSPQTTKIFNGVNPYDPSIISRREVGVTEGVFEEVDSRAVTSELEGEQKVEGAQASGRFPYSANAVMRSAYRRRPWDAFRIEHDGKATTWVVTTIRHVVSGYDYKAEVVFGSDGVDYVKRMKDGRVDISFLLSRNERALRPTPTIISSRPYFVGTGANAVVSDQRWKARVMTVPVDDEFSELPFTPPEEGTST